MGYTKIIRSGNFVEVYEYKKNLSERRPRIKKSRRDNSRPRPRRYDNMGNTRKRIRRTIRANLVGNTPPALLTLTMLQVLPIKASWAAFTGFITRLRKITGNDIRYISVLEFQKRGAIHFHALVWGIPDHVILHEKRTRNLQHQWLRGFCDCIRTDGNPALAGYLIKYLSKSVRDIRISGQKAYSCSRNMLRPMSAGGNTLSDFLEEFVDIHSDPLHKREFETEWLGTCSYRSYLIDNPEAKIYAGNSDKSLGENHV